MGSNDFAACLYEGQASAVLGFRFFCRLVQCLTGHCGDGRVLTFLLCTVSCMACEQCDDDRRNTARVVQLFHVSLLN